jgi:hypothetical protein
MDFELAQDHLAGPMYAIRQDGECDYVFANDPRFPGVDSPAKFRSWCMEAIAFYREVAQRVDPADPDERRDMELLLRQATLMEQVVDLAVTIVEGRFRAGQIGLGSTAKAR